MTCDTQSCIKNSVDGDNVMHKLPKDEVVRAARIHAILKVRKALKSEKDIPKNCYVCSMHFRDGKPTKNNLVQTLFLTLSTIMLPAPARSRKPCKRATSTKTSKTNLKKRLCFPPHGSPPNEQNLSVISASTPCISESQGAPDVSGIVGELELVTKDVGAITNFQDESQRTTAIPMQFTHITKECDICTFTSLEGAQMFKAVFDLLKPKTSVMTYWDGQKKTLQMRKRGSSVELRQSLLSLSGYNLDPVLLPVAKPGPSRKLITGVRVVVNSDETSTESIKCQLGISISNF